MGLSSEIQRKIQIKTEIQILIYLERERENYVLQNKIHLKIVTITKQTIFKTVDVICFEKDKISRVLII